MIISAFRGLAEFLQFPIPNEIRRNAQNVAPAVGDSEYYFRILDY